MVEVDPERFEVMVGEPLDGLPEELGELMSNVAVTVQHDAGPAGPLGLYQGVPLTRRPRTPASVLELAAAGWWGPGKGQIWSLPDHPELAAAMPPAGRYDRCWLPRTSIVTGRDRLP